jgi:hypothetical protein
MKTCTVLVAMMFALTSYPILAQQSPMDTPSNQPATQPQAPPGAQPAPTPDNTPSSAPAAQPEQASPAATPEASAATPAAPAAALSPVNGELVSKLDSKTAKNGDDVVVETKASAKTSDGTEIPKGSKLVGHVVGVQSSKAGQNSEVVLQFDKAQLKGGQTLPIHSEIQSIEPAEGAAASGGSDSAANSGMSRPSMGGAATSNPGSPAGDNGGGTTGNAGASPASPGYASGAGAGSASGGPAAGTVVARTGSIAIRATSIPGVLLANNEAGQQDPRMGQASSILLGSKQDVHLEGGTKMVIGVAPAAGGSAEGATTKQ